MGTRGAYGFIVDGKTKISYNHSDSYPSGLGKDIIDFISRNRLATIIKYAKSIKMVESSKQPNASQLKKLIALGIVEPDNKSDWYSVLREFQGNLQQSFENQNPFMTDESKFVLDSLMCEYAYIINLDDGILEFYEGFNEQPILTGRFANTTSDRGYYAVRHVKNYPLEDLFACDSSIIVENMENLTSESD